jgi:hypothetical protein
MDRYYHIQEIESRLLKEPLITPIIVRHIAVSHRDRNIMTT